MSKPWVKNRDVALYGGIASAVLAAALLHDAFENRGKSRPFLAKFLPSV